MLVLSLLLVLAPSRSWAQDDGAGTPADARRTIQAAVGQGRIPHTVADTAVMYFAMLDGDARLERLSPVADGQLWLGVPEGYFFDKLDEGTRAAFAAARTRLLDAGHSIANVSIAQLFIAGAVPGVLLAALMALYAVLFSGVRSDPAPMPWAEPS